MKKLFIPLLFILLLLLASCSSGPKRQMFITTIQDSCKDTLESANSCILNGSYAQAEELLEKARIQAVSIDNYDLLLSVALAHVSLYLSYNPPETEKAKLYLEQAYLIVPNTRNTKESAQTYSGWYSSR